MQEECDIAREVSKMSCRRKEFLYLLYQEGTTVNRKFSGTLEFETNFVLAI